LRDRAAHRAVRHRDRARARLQKVDSNAAGPPALKAMKEAIEGVRASIAWTRPITGCWSSISRFPDRTSLEL
jgi:hypothetical protein